MSHSANPVSQRVVRRPVSNSEIQMGILSYQHLSSFTFFSFSIVLICALLCVLSSVTALVQIAWTSSLGTLDSQVLAPAGFQYQAPSA